MAIDYYRRCTLGFELRTGKFCNLRPFFFTSFILLGISHQNTITHRIINNKYHNFIRISTKQRNINSEI